MAGRAALMYRDIAISFRSYYFVAQLPSSSGSAEHGQCIRRGVAIQLHLTNRRAFCARIPLAASSRAAASATLRASTVAGSVAILAALGGVKLCLAPLKEASRRSAIRPRDCTDNYPTWKTESAHTYIAIFGEPGAVGTSTTKRRRDGRRRAHRERRRLMKCERHGARHLLQRRLDAHGVVPDPRRAARLREVPLRQPVGGNQPHWVFEHLPGAGDILDQRGDDQREPQQVRRWLKPVRKYDISVDRAIFASHSGYADQDRRQWQHPRQQDELRRHQPQDQHNRFLSGHLGSATGTNLGGHDLFGARSAYVVRSSGRRLSAPTSVEPLGSRRLRESPPVYRDRRQPPGRRNRRLVAGSKVVPYATCTRTLQGIRAFYTCKSKSRSGGTIYYQQAASGCAH